MVQILSEAAPVTEPDLGKAIVENCSKLNLSDDAKLLVKKAVDDALALAKKEKCDKPETARRVLKAAGDALEKSGIKGIGDRIEADGKKAIENATKTKVSPSKQDIIATKNKSKNGHGPVPSKRKSLMISHRNPVANQMEIKWQIAKRIRKPRRNLTVKVNRRVNIVSCNKWQLHYHCVILRSV